MLSSCWQVVNMGLEIGATTSTFGYDEVWIGILEQLTEKLLQMGK